MTYDTYDTLSCIATSYINYLIDTGTHTFSYIDDTGTYQARHGLGHSAILFVTFVSYNPLKNSRRQIAECPDVYEDRDLND